MLLFCGFIICEERSIKHEPKTPWIKYRRKDRNYLTRFWRHYYIYTLATRTCFGFFWPRLAAFRGHRRQGIEIASEELPWHQNKNMNLPIFSDECLLTLLN